MWFGCFGTVSEQFAYRRRHKFCCSFITALKLTTINHRQTTRHPLSGLLQWKYSKKHCVSMDVVLTCSESLKVMSYNSRLRSSPGYRPSEQSSDCVSLSMWLQWFENKTNENKLPVFLPLRGFFSTNIPIVCPASCRFLSNCRLVTASQMIWSVLLS